MSVTKRGQKPNVVYVIADQWRAQAFGYTGDPNARTPVIDRFAAESLNFSQAVSGAPVCCPARASLMTGQYPLTHGVYINDVPLEPAGPTLAEEFRNAGYATAYIGKWHLYGSPDGHYGRRDAYVPEDKRFGFEYWKAAECSHDYNNSAYYEGDDRTKRYWSGYDAFAQTEDACRFLRDRAEDSAPYFMMLSYGPPHFPLETAPQRYRDMYAERAIELRANVPRSASDAAVAALRGYYAHIAALDDCFARLLGALEETGSADDTVVVLASDHGDMMGSQGFPAEQKLVPWDESVRVPLLIRYPRMVEPGESPALIDMPDHMPTLLGLCGLPVPESVQGTNYADGEPSGALPRTSAFLSMPVPIMMALERGIAEYRGVRDRRHTYVRSIHGPWLLYDNETDPYQLRNLCGLSSHRTAQKRLDVELDLWLDALGDDFLSAQVYLERDSLSHYREVQYVPGSSRSPWGDWKSTIPEGRS